jgi:SseB protein N-terminal domain
VRHDRLTAALTAFHQTDNAQTSREVLAALNESELIFPAAERAAGEQAVRLAFTLDGQGRPVLPAFTDQQQFSLWLPGGGPYAKAAALGFLPTILAGPLIGLLINPGSAASALVDRRAIELLASGEPLPTADIDLSLVRRWI